MAKNRYLAALLSFLIAGLGQLYVGKYWRAVAFFLLEVWTSIIYMNQNTATIGLALNTIVGAASMVDAYQLAKRTEEKIMKPSLPEEPEIKIKAY